MKTTKKETILVSSTILLLWLLFLLFMGVMYKFWPREADEPEPEETPDVPPIVYISPNLSEVTTTAEDLYSVHWEEKDVARWIAEVSPYISEFEALDLVNMVREITESTTEIDYRYILSVIYVESRFNSEVISSAGAVGYMQLIPKWFTRRLFDHGYVYLSDPEANITLGVEYLDEMYQASGDLRLAIMGYNMGFEEAKTVYDGSTNFYTKEVEGTYRELIERVS